MDDQLLLLRQINEHLPGVLAVEVRPRDVPALHIEVIVLPALLQSHHE